MRCLLPLFIIMLLCRHASAQVVITSADMPVAGDTLRYSTAPATTAINPKDSGLSMIWNYALSSVSQGIDTYLNATGVNPTYGAAMDPAAFGHKIGDSIGGLLPVYYPYTFFQNTTDSFIAIALGAEASGTPTPANYAKPDVWYHFPLTYQRTDADTFSLNFDVPGTGSITQTGYRETRADGWGVLITPYSSGIRCLRIRSAIFEIDSVTLGTTGYAPVPRNTVEYKWLANGEHYPLLWVTSEITGSTETITSIRFRDVVHDTATSHPIDTPIAVQNVRQANNNVIAYPNPTVDGIVTLSLPDTWKNQLLVVVYDIKGMEVSRFKDDRVLDMRSFPSGIYLARIVSGTQTAYTKIVR